MTLKRKGEKKARNNKGERKKLLTNLEFCLNSLPSSRGSLGKGKSSLDQEILLQNLGPIWFDVGVEITLAEPNCAGTSRERPSQSKLCFQHDRSIIKPKWHLEWIKWFKISSLSTLLPLFFRPNLTSFYFRKIVIAMNIGVFFKNAKRHRVH